MLIFKKNIKRAIKKLDSSNGLSFALWNLIKELIILFFHIYSLFRVYRYRSLDTKKLNLGCGKNIKNGWINIDFNIHSDLSLDLRKKIPFVNNSISIIYCEHFLEHLEYPKEVIHFLRESYRILKPGGIISLGVPDTEWPLYSYVNKDNRYFEMAKKIWHPEWCFTRLDHINYHFRQCKEHKYAYDYETLKNVLELTGFDHIKKRSYNPQLDNEERSIGTLYVEAKK